MPYHPWLEVANGRTEGRKNGPAHPGGSISRLADRGAGYGTDAARTILHYGFQHLGLHRVEGQTAEFNAAARRALEKLGFRQEGRRRQALYRSGRYWDSLIYGLLRDEFKAPP